MRGGRGWHGNRGWLARGARMNAGGGRRVRRAARQNRERGKGRLTSGARRGIFIFFSFFFLGCDNSPPLKKISSRDLGRQEGKDKTRIRLRSYSPRHDKHLRDDAPRQG